MLLSSLTIRVVSVDFFPDVVVLVNSDGTSVVATTAAATALACFVSFRPSHLRYIRTEEPL